MTAKDRSVLRLPRREFLARGGLGVLGTFIAASTLEGVAGIHTASAQNVKANLAALTMGTANASYSGMWAFRVAQALGFLEDVGIGDFEIILSSEYIPGLISGSLDVSLCDTDVLFGSSRASGLPMKLISVYRHMEWQMMGVRPGIETPEDLKGARITGGGLDQRNTYNQRRIVEKLGLDPDNDVEFVPGPIGSDARLQALLAGVVDAASLFPRHRFALEEAGGKFLYEELVATPQECFGAMQRWLDENEETAYAWCLADLRARQWLHDPANKERAYRIMRDLGYEIPPQFVDLYQVELDQIGPDGGFETSGMDGLVDVLKLTGTLPGDFAWREYVDMRYAWAAQDALGLPRRPASL